VLPAADAYYEHVGGRFRFRGRCSDEVESAVRSTAAGFRVRGLSLRDNGVDGLPTTVAAPAGVGT
jgi:hypothetical protein